MNIGKTVRVALSLSLVAAAFAAVMIPQVGCSADVCSTSEEQACTSTYTTCTQAAAATADLAACQKCVTDYCNCYDACGNTCDEQTLNASCGAGG
jgi:hypothetical protein